jgi:hypothetical protein
MTDQPRRQVPARRPRRRIRIEGNDLLYHFMQKTLFETDVAQFRGLASRLVADLGVWLAPSTYQRLPLLLAYAVRDPACRGNRSKGIPDEWGSPNEDGYFRDDNSLIKGLPRSLAIRNPSNPLVHKRHLGTSFVASHVWRVLAGGGHASRKSLTYSFIPNVVWLPSQVSKLSDREGSFVQSFLQALSTRIYRDVKLTPKLEAMVGPIWETLPLRSEVADLMPPDPATLNYFDADEAWITRRIRALQLVIQGLGEAKEGRPPSRKIISTRYSEGLPQLPRPAIESLLSFLLAYSDAVGEASSD